MLVLVFALTKEHVFISHIAVTKREHSGQPQCDSPTKRLWRGSTEDPEPLFAPVGARTCLAPVKAGKRSTLPHPSQQVKYIRSIFLGFSRNTLALILSS